MMVSWHRMRYRLIFARLNRQRLTEVVSPRIDRNGRIDQWPEGFFDTWDLTLNGLLEPAVR